MSSSGVRVRDRFCKHIFHFLITPRKPDAHPERERERGEPVAPKIHQEAQWLTLGRLQVRWRLDLCFRMQKAGNLDSPRVPGRVYSGLWPPQRLVCAALMSTNPFADYALASWFRQISICLMIYKAFTAFCPHWKKSNNWTTCLWQSLDLLRFT